MREDRTASVERRSGRSVPVGCQKGKRSIAGNNSISDHAGIILEALNDYRRWFCEDEDSDKDIIKSIDDAIEFVQQG